jgi:NAD(P)-dependent dehydrogenase (short-subunit alcohol dehydrogenase family)
MAEIGAAARTGTAARTGAAARIAADVADLEDVSRVAAAVRERGAGLGLLLADAGIAGAARPPGASRRTSRPRRRCSRVSPRVFR